MWTNQEIEARKAFDQVERDKMKYKPGPDGKPREPTEREKRLAV